MGHKVDRGVSLVSAEQSGEGGVTAVVESLNADGTPHRRTIRARYLCGADGSHSFVRQSFGIPFEGKGYDFTALMTDAKMDFGRDRNSKFTSLMQFSSSRGVILVFPFGDEYFRVVVINHGEKRRGKDQPPLTLDEIQSAVDAAIPGKPKLYDPRWLTTWGSQLKQAKTYRVDNVFLLGDAAHVHSPAGGQGLNTSVQDAVNLGWKLAAVIKGEASESLLDTYHEERHPIGSRVLFMSDMLLRGVLLNNGIARFARDMGLRAVARIPLFRNIATANLTGVGVNYRRTTMKIVGAALGVSAVQEGDRMPDFELLVATKSQTHGKTCADASCSSSPRTRMFKVISKGTFTLLFFINASDLCTLMPAIHRTILLARSRSKAPINVALIVRGGIMGGPGDVEFETYIDIRASMKHKLGYDKAMQVL
ncbi:hypothetical protein HK102_011374, partial [Quaeritorhiza haematococci]